MGWISSPIFQGQTIDVSYKAVFILKYSGLHDEEGDKINIRNMLIETQRQSVHFLYFMMTVHPDQADPKCKYNRMTCRACVQIPLYVYGIDASIDNQMMKNPHDIIVHLVALDYGRNTDIGLLKK